RSLVADRPFCLQVAFFVRVVSGESLPPGRARRPLPARLELRGWAEVNPIQAENALPGSGGWQVPRAAEHAIDGYTGEVSDAPGQSLDLHVSTAPAAPYRVEIYRLGWYGGAGGRLVACLPSCTEDEPGTPRP